MNINIRTFPAGITLSFTQCAAIELSFGADDYSAENWYIISALVKIFSLCLAGVELSKERVSVTVLNCHLTIFWSC